MWHSKFMQIYAVYWLRLASSVFYWSENSIDWLPLWYNEMCNATCIPTQVSLLLFPILWLDMRDIESSSNDLF